MKKRTDRIAGMILVREMEDKKMIRDERCEAGKLVTCENIKMGRYQDVHHDAFKV